jgi:hypothetical protein
MLHQFLSAETVQVSEEGVLFIFLVFIFLSHECTVLCSLPLVNTQPLESRFLFAPKALRQHSARFQVVVIVQDTVFL